MLNTNVDGMEEKAGIPTEMFYYASFLSVCVSTEGRLDSIKLFYRILK